MTKTAALHQFFNTFCAAYPAGTVPAGATMPWITYEPYMGFLGGQAANSTVTLWYHTESEAVPNAKAEQIGKAIGAGGVLLPCDDGTIWIKRGSPWCNSITDPNDPTIKRRILNVTIEFLTL